MRRKEQSISARFRVSRELKELAGRLKRWRKSQGRRRLPDELWEQAVAVAGQEGVYRTAHTLHLDYANLKRRVEAAEAVTTAITPDKRKASRRSDHILSLTANRASEPPAFIEILSDTIASECLIEVEGAGGRMRIQMKLSAPEVMNLVRDWRARE